MHTSVSGRFALGDKMPKPFRMDSDTPTVIHQRREERPHIAQEVAETPQETPDKARAKHGPLAAEEFVRGLLPKAAQAALGSKHPRRPAPWFTKAHRIVVE